MTDTTCYKVNVYCIAAIYKDHPTNRRKNLFELNITMNDLTMYAFGSVCICVYEFAFTLLRYILYVPFHLSVLYCSIRIRCAHNTKVGATNERQRMRTHTLKPHFQFGFCK